MNCLETWLRKECDTGDETKRSISKEVVSGARRKNLGRGTGGSRTCQQAPVGHVGKGSKVENSRLKARKKRCVAPMALRIGFGLVFPAFTGWANLWRTYGASLWASECLCL